MAAAFLDRVARPREFVATGIGFCGWRAGVGGFTLRTRASVASRGGLLAHLMLPARTALKIRSGRGEGLQ